MSLNIDSLQRAERRQRAADEIGVENIRNERRQRRTPHGRRNKCGLCRSLQHTRRRCPMNVPGYGLMHGPLFKECHDAGPLEIQCIHCGSFSFGEEKLNCCKDGKVQVEVLPGTALQQELFFNNIHFQNNIRRLNNDFSFTSLQTNIIPPRGYVIYLFIYLHFSLFINNIY